MTRGIDALRVCYFGAQPSDWTTTRIVDGPRQEADRVQRDEPWR